MSQEAAYQALADLAELSRQHAKALPAQVDASPRWSGIGFSLLGERFVASLGQVVEMLEVPAYTRLPGVQPWAVGIANVRGRLLPLVDLTAYIAGKPGTHNKKQQRVLVIDIKNYLCGLIVDQAFGMQHFTSERFTEEVDFVPSAVRPLVKGAYLDGVNNPWAVMHIPALVKDARFANAAQS